MKEMYFSLALVMLAVVPSICKGQHENTCSVVTKNEYIEVGSDTDIMCQTSCINGKIFWTLNNIPVNESLSNTINSSHTVLSLRNFTHRIATLQCHSADTQYILGGTTIKTYLKPNNISCILHNENQSVERAADLFTCSWEHQFHDAPVSYIVRASQSKHLTRDICKSNTKNCTNSSDDISVIDDISITVTAITADWKADSDPHVFHPLYIRKIIPPSLEVTASDDHVLVKWKRARDQEECQCQVKYSVKAVNETPKLRNITQKGHGEMTIREVKSCSNYEFSVRCAFNKAPWSDWSEKKMVLTKLNKSDVALRLWRTVAEPERNGVRKVHVMWTEIPSTCPDTFAYKIGLTPYKQHTPGQNNASTLCGKSTCDVDRDAHRIHLTLLHNEALFVEESVYVPPIGESLPQVTNIQTSALEGVILVSWEAPFQLVSGYMIDWTHDGNQYYWMESEYTNATLSDLLDKKPYNITVTPLFDNKTGHGIQAFQVCSRVGDPGNVTIQVQANDKGATVSWTVGSQGACSGVVVNYTIFYGVQGGPQHNYTVDDTKKATSLENLKPDTQYSVYVKATALTGTTKSNETLFKTKRFGSGLIAALSICGSIIILLVLSLGLCCAVWWKKFREKLVPNPGLSSVAAWPTLSHQEGMCPFQPFSYPTESLCDRAYTDESQRRPTSPPATGYDENPASDQMEEYIDPATVSAPHVQNEEPVEPVKTQDLSSPDDSTALLPSVNSPYRSQTSVQSPASRSSKQCKRVPVKQPEPPVMVYVTLDMFSTQAKLISSE